MYLLKPSVNKSDLAIIERSDTAAHDIEAGQYVSWHGKLGKAKAAILQGATLDDTLFDYDDAGALNSSIFPDYTNEDTSVNLIQGGNTFTVEKTGWYSYCLHSRNGVVAQLSVNSKIIAQSHSSSTLWGNVTGIIPLTKGDVVTVSGSPYGDMPRHMYYIPFLS